MLPPADVRTRWEPVLHKFAPTVQNSGLRGFTVEFKWSEYSTGCRCLAAVDGGVVDGSQQAAGLASQRRLSACSVVVAWAQSGA